ncbi:MAG: type I-E CRISPR-associated protein Cas5/CasD [Desulfovibrionaceae bacterium]|nr:type I-E CRISPR-associated protein Cas5/CasD [Desulfovibrionaceae bacterium]
MPAYLVFQLHGALQAYGLAAVGEVRHSASHPTRSAVFGLLAACLGLRREDAAGLSTLSASYALAVREDKPGAPLLDYHTVQTPPEAKKRVYRTRADELGGLLGRGESPYTVLSRRGYLCDAHFTACLWAACDRPPHSLETLAEALKKPRFVPYLGRKSCPASLPFDPKVADYPDTVAALAAYRLDAWAFPDKWKAPEHVRLYAEAMGHEAKPAHGGLVRDMALYDTQRQYQERIEIMTEVAPAALREDTPKDAAGEDTGKEEGHVLQSPAP